MAGQHRWSDEKLENFLQEMIREHPSEAVAELVYCPTLEEYGSALRRHLPDHYQNEQVVALQWRRTKTRNQVATTVSDPYRLGLHTPSLIIVYPVVKEYSPEECISLLKDHEYVHVQDWFDGIPINATRRITAEEEPQFLKKTIIGIMKARAYRHQLAVMPEYLKEERMGRAAKQRCQEHLRALDLLLYSTLMPLERETIKLFLKEVGYTPRN
ncbi:hypothetical protein J4210_01895 [Candidatus Woesearchaeota archaeon]|nr:hypothetical protein [Candidatus Woesearchaeota archaeon]